ncbi:MAG: NAD(P)/FAD-dependent oxidoreductase [Clostridiales bacterium]|nr:NAD(P)/FAD-dependent oxidoreductase [Candidatus Crickella merdequi]
MERFAIIGFGAAGYAALKAIRECGSDAQIDIYSDHDYAPYNPMLTTYYIKGAIPYEAMFPFGSLEDIAAKYDCAIYKNTEVEDLKASPLSITTGDGEARCYDKVLIATGAAPVLLPVGDIPAEKLYTMRTVDDARRLKEAFDSGAIRKILVIGASWVGIKVVEAAWARGIECVMADMAEQIFATSAFEGASIKCEEYLAEEGIDSRFGVKATGGRIGENGRCQVIFSDGSETEVDAIAVCVGIRPAASFADSTIARDKAIIVDNNMKTSAEGVYAAGDVAEGIDMMTGRTRHIGLWANSATQGRCAGLAMAGREEPTEGNILHNITHFLNYNFISFGDKDAEGERRVLVDEGSRYIEILHRDGKLYCINMLGDYELSGAVKNCIIKYFSKGTAELNELELGVIAKSGLPNELIRILGGMVK